MASNGTAATTRDLLTVASGVARLNYFYGQLLTQRDLFTEQRYHLELRRLLQREAFGTGTVAGLRVEDAGATTQGSVFVRAGLAMDPDGRELLLTHDQCVTVAAPVTTNATPTTYATDLPTMAAQLSATTAWNATIYPIDLASTNDPGSLLNRLQAAGLTEVDGDPVTSGSTVVYSALAAQLGQLKVPPGFMLKPGQLLRDVLFDALVGTTYLGLQYVERGTEPSPTVLDASCCGTATCFPSRREEGVVIVAQDHPFHPLPDAYLEALEKITGDLVREENPASSPGSARCERALCEVVLGGWRGLPPEDPCGTGHLPVVPLARIYWSRFARNSQGKSRVLSVDNCFRPLAPGVPPVRALLDALTQSTALAPTAPRFDKISPPDHAQITVVTTTTGTTTVITATVTAQATSLLAPVSSTSWEVYYYPASPTTTTPILWNASTPPAPPFAFTIALQTSSVPSATNPKATAVELVFTSTASPPVTNFLPSGVYRWRLNIDATNPIQALQTHAVVEGILEAVFYVP